MLRLSKKLIERIKLSPERQYKIAQKVGIHPATLSGWVCGITTPKKRDRRLLKLGKVIGVLPSEIWEEVEDE